MSRTAASDGKRELLAVRVSEQTAVRIDAARGSVSRADWLRAAIAAALEVAGLPGREDADSSRARLEALEEALPVLDSRLGRVESVLEQAGAFRDY
jgi:hypothetical protein